MGRNRESRNKSVGKKKRQFPKIRWNKGSLTVEAAYVLPVTFLITVLCITILFFYHDRVWYRAASYEAALLANGETGTRAEAEEAANERLSERVEGRVLPGTAPETSAEADQNGTTVRVGKIRYPVFDREEFAAEHEIRVKRVRPAETLRKMKMLEAYQDALQG